MEQRAGFLQKPFWLGEMFDHGPERDRVKLFFAAKPTPDPSLEGNKRSCAAPLLGGVRGGFVSALRTQLHKTPARDRHAARLGIIQRRAAHVRAEDFVIAGPALLEL